MKLGEPVKYMPDQREFVNKLGKLEGLGGRRDGYLGTIGDKGGGDYRRDNNNNNNMER